MNPYWQSESVQIYNADCLEVLAELPDESIAAVISDPPFSSGARTDAGKAMRGAMLRGVKWQDDWFSHDNLATFGFLFLMRLVSTELFRVTKQGGSCHLFIDWRMYPNLYGVLESTGWNVKNLVVWDKQNFGMGTNYRNQHELIIYAEKGDCNFRNHNMGNVQKVKRVQAEYHPTEKPISLLERFIDNVTDEGETVFDPFCGSGTTLVAARNIGRKGIGSEISKDYCDVSVERLAQGWAFTPPNNRLHSDAGESADLQADFYTPADSTSQALSTPTQRR